jgi:hypothetical protein
LKDLASAEAKRREPTVKAMTTQRVDDERIIDELQKIVATDPVADVRTAALLALEPLGQTPRAAEITPPPLVSQAGPPRLPAVCLGIALHLLLIARFTIPFSTIPIGPSAARIWADVAIFFCSLLVDAMVAAYDVFRFSPKAIVNAREAAIVSELARLVVAGVSVGVAGLAFIYEFLVIGDRPLSSTDLQANPLLTLALVLGAIASVYIFSLALFFITMPVAAFSGAICSNVLQRNRGSRLIGFALSPVTLASVLFVAI